MSGDRVVEVELTRTMLVHLTEDESEQVLHKLADYTDLCERVARWERIAHHDSHHFAGDLAVIPATDLHLLDWCAPTIVDAVNDRPSYLWSARTFVGRARYELSCGRYREGNCPELDEVNLLLGRLEERLRLMALAVDAEVQA